MFEEVASRLAFDTTVSDSELQACRNYVVAKIKFARDAGEPAPLLEYRSFRVFDKALNMRETRSQLTRS